MKTIMYVKALFVGVKELYKVSVDWENGREHYFLYDPAGFWEEVPAPDDLVLEELDNDCYCRLNDKEALHYLGIPSWPEGAAPQDDEQEGNLC